MATKLGLHLQNLANNVTVMEAIKQYGPLAYAVIIKFNEYSLCSQDGEVSCGINTYGQISQELRCKVEDVISILEFLEKKKFITKTVVSMYNTRLKEIVAHHNDVQAKRIASAEKSKDKSGRPPKYSEHLDEKTQELYDKFLEMYRKIFQKGNKGDKKSKRQFNGRIKEGFTLEDFEIAMVNAKNDEWQTKNDYLYCTPEYLTRDTMLNKWRYAKVKKASGAVMTARLSQQIND